MQRFERLPWAASYTPPGGKLHFRNAKEEETLRLKKMYEQAWGCGIKIDEDQLAAKIRRFPEGQIVGCEGLDGQPISMINIMLTQFDPNEGFRGGYERVTGGRTFSTHVPVERLVTSGLLPIALCVSIAVSPEHAKNGYALETLNHAIGFAEEHGLYAAPYSAPRGYAAAKAENPQLGILDYLEMSMPPSVDYETHSERVMKLNSLRRVSRAFSWTESSIRGIPSISRDIFRSFSSLPADSFSAKRTRYSMFLDEFGGDFLSDFGRFPLFEDFCLISGSEPIDPTMRMHIKNGARYIRDSKGNLSAVFEESRPEDKKADGYNVVLTYAYHPLLGQDFVSPF